MEMTSARASASEKNGSAVQNGALPPRERLIAAALKLFTERGFRAVGIDAILAEAGVAKMTLYSHFDSKDALIAAALARLENQWGAWLGGRVLPEGAPAKERLLSVFDALTEWFGREDFAGCTFIKASSEFPERTHQVHQLAHEHRVIAERFFESIARQAGARDAALLTRQLFLLVEGAIVVAQLSGGQSPASDAKHAAAALIESATRG
ncbi:MAG: TetR/AcrR family transcriptional regulator [Planctomycetota bacterium]|nr:TetR/AcrR family transcriptional regulator [Planctomycetota bacterium]